MRVSLITLLFSSMLDLIGSDIVKNIKEEIGLPTVDIITKHGYPVEINTVQTLDGYLLEIHRIPHGKNNRNSRKIQPVLIFSGIYADSASFISFGSKKSLAFVLADLGYDVWLGNTRGTTNCRKHITLDPKKHKKQFWNFSFQEMALYDVPNTIDYILNKTNQNQLFYIGYSQGTSSVFGMLADNPIYNKKIRLVLALAPVINIKNCEWDLVKALSSEMAYYEDFVDNNELYDFMPLTNEGKQLRISLCSLNSPTYNLCVLILCKIFYFSYDQLNQVRLPVILSNFPAGGSFKEIQHYVQLRKGSFQKYDYGRNNNLKIYQQETPPVYNLSNVQVPTALFYGSIDRLATYKDNVETLADKLPNIIYLRNFSGFSHMDMLFGANFHKFITADIGKLLQLYQ